MSPVSCAVSLAVINAITGLLANRPTLSFRFALPRHSARTSFFRSRFSRRNETQRGTSLTSVIMPDEEWRCREKIRLPGEQPSTILLEKRHRASWYVNYQAENKRWFFKLSVWSSRRGCCCYIASGIFVLVDLLTGRRLLTFDIQFWKGFKRLCNYFRAVI